MVCGDPYNIEDVLSLFLNEPTFNTEPRMDQKALHGFNSFSFIQETEDMRSLNISVSVASYHAAKKMLKQMSYDRCVFIYHTFRRASLIMLREMTRIVTCPKMFIEVRYSFTASSPTHQSTPPEEVLFSVLAPNPEYFKSSAYKQLIVSFLIDAGMNRSSMASLGQLQHIDETSSRSSTPKSDKSEQSDDTSTDSNRSATASQDCFAESDSSIPSSETLFCEDRVDLEVALAHRHTSRDFDVASHSADVHMEVDVHDVLHDNHDMEQTVAEAFEKDDEQTMCKATRGVHDVHQVVHEIEQTNVKAVDMDDAQTFCKTICSDIDRCSTSARADPVKALQTEQEPSNVTDDLLNPEILHIALKDELTEETFALTKAAKKEMARDVRIAKKAAKRARRAQRNCERMIEEFRNKGTGCSCTIS